MNSRCILRKPKNTIMDVRRAAYAAQRKCVFTASLAIGAVLNLVMVCVFWLCIQYKKFILDSQAIWMHVLVHVPLESLNMKHEENHGNGGFCRRNPCGFLWCWYLINTYSRALKILLYSKNTKMISWYSIYH